MYELTLDAAWQAQHAFKLERGHRTRQFLPDCAWDDLHQGLLAGEQLGLAPRHMEKAYLDEIVREHELTKHFSLRLHFPLAFLRRGRRTLRDRHSGAAVSISIMPVISCVASAT